MHVVLTCHWTPINQFIFCLPPTRLFDIPVQGGRDPACPDSTRCRSSSATSWTSATTPVVTTNRSGCRPLHRCRWCQLRTLKYSRSSVAVPCVKYQPTWSLFTARRSAYRHVRLVGPVSGSATALPWLVEHRARCHVMVDIFSFSGFHHYTFQDIYPDEEFCMECRLLHPRSTRYGGRFGGDGSSVDFSV